ncbi:hypothetical protein HRI_000886500 [Hibiscus trionum]|uniref:WRKY domain-containing protein n=1 Tax=Hibiscus trionum TaxID=183268 RepID=A0A9W7H705_HIBTR|nr:hypothetical protein HRI_000886500 [Hibiscus trionum]
MADMRFPGENPSAATTAAAEACGGDKWDSFMDLLGVHQDLFAPSIFDSYPPLILEDILHEEVLQLDTKHKFLPSPPFSAVPEYSECLNNNPPATPNSSSISSLSNEEAANDEQQTKADEDPDKTRKVGKSKKKNQRKERVPRFAFMTKSEIDHLDDGYRWRKYGQKPVKNCPFPRSYYRCTNGGCGVKKRVERSSDDTTIVVTTYEGQHTHPCPITSRGSIEFAQQQVQPYIHTSFPSLGDHGLLQDIVVPTHMMNQAKDQV